jgi:hypothetical protein
MRWAAIPKKGDDFSPLSQTFTDESILTPSKHDDPKRDWLGNPFSAHVNPTFWKLHGWIDDVVVDWLKANDFTEISENCENRPGCYQWKSTWVGGGDHKKAMPLQGTMPHDHSHPPNDGRDFSPADRAILKKTVDSLARKASFANEKFDSFLNMKNLPRGPRQDPADDNLEDPEVFVDRFGPCSK